MPVTLLLTPCPWLPNSFRATQNVPILECPTRVRTRDKSVFRFRRVWTHFVQCMMGHLPFSHWMVILSRENFTSFVGYCKRFVIMYSKESIAFTTVDINNNIVVLVYYLYLENEVIWFILSTRIGREMKVDYCNFSKKYCSLILENVEYNRYFV